MNSLKKLVVLMPVLVLTWAFFSRDHFQEYSHANNRRLILLAVTVGLFYVWAIIGIARRRQDRFFDIAIQASFYVYLFSVLTLTGYFELFNQVSSHDWWHKLLQRVQHRDKVSLQPFTFTRIHHWWFYWEVVGNFIMLLPLGIYLPLLYKRIHNFFTVTFTAMMLSVCIELMQLATNYRITDIDDVILNTAGAALGFLIFLVINPVLFKPMHTRPEARPVPEFISRKQD